MPLSFSDCFLNLIPDSNLLDSFYVFSQRYWSCEHHVTLYFFLVIFFFSWEDHFALRHVFLEAEKCLTKLNIYGS